jgi:hypothetical protein
MEIQINGDPVFQIKSFIDWQNRGQKLFAPWVKRDGKDHTVHLFDSKGHLLICGQDIKTADENGNAPFTAYELTRPKQESKEVYWIPLGQHTYDMFNSMAVKNCLCKFDDGTVCHYEDNHPLAEMTHFQKL